MADRSVVVRLTANIAGYASSMTAAARITQQFGDAAAMAAARQGAAWKQVARMPLIAGAALGVLTAASIMAATEFDKQMSVVKANIDDKSAPAMRRLADAALQAGRTTTYSATEAAKAEEELAKAGISAADITGGALSAALSLASAGQLDLGTAAEITASTMVQFGMAAKDTAHIADLLAAGADKSLGGVVDLAEALKYAGVPAHQFGISLDETVGSLALFASNGILGSMAGTSMRMMLTRLASPTASAADEMKNANLQFFDAQGNFKGVANMAEELHTKLSKMTVQQREATLATLFGARSLAESNILYTAGAAGVENWTKKVNEQGFATQQAATKLDNLAGDFKKLTNTLNVAFIEAGQSAQGPLRGVVKDVTSVVDAFTRLPEGVKSASVEIAGGTAVILLAVGGFIMLSVKIGETVKAFKELQIASKLSFMAGPWGAAIGLATIAVGLFVKSQMDSAAAVESLTGTLDQQTGAITGNTTAMNAKTLQDAGALDAAKALGVSLSLVTGAASGNVDQLKQLNDQLATLRMQFPDTSAKSLDARTSIDLVSTTVNGMSSNLSEAQKKTKQLAEAQVAAVDPTKAAATAATENAKTLKDQADATNAAVKASDDLIKSVTEYGNILLGARGSQRSYRQSVDDATKAIKDNGRTLDVNTDKGRKNGAALDNLASSALKYIGEQFKQDTSTMTVARSTALATGRVLEARDAFIRNATQMGMSSKAAGALATQLGLTKGDVQRLNDAMGKIPPVVRTKVDVDTRLANGQIDGAARKLRALDGQTATMSVNVNISQAMANLGVLRKQAAIDASSAALPAVKRARGGYISGAGSGTSDSVPLDASNGEYVINAAEVSKRGRGYFDALNSGFMPSAGTRAVPVAGGGPQRISGTLDLGNGLHGLVEGVVHSVNDRQAREVSYGGR